MALFMSETVSVQHHKHTSDHQRSAKGEANNGI